MVAVPFLITGLPRSRTAWLCAVANTVPGAVCWHEPLIRFPTWRASLELWRDAGHRWAGISDSSLLLHLPEIMAAYEPRTIVVQRNPADAIASLSRLFPGVESSAVLLRAVGCMETVRALPDVRIVSFEALADPVVVVDALAWAMPGAELDAAKVGEFHRLRIERDAEQVRRAVAAMTPERLRALVED